MFYLKPAMQVDRAIDDSFFSVFQKNTKVISKY